MDAIKLLKEDHDRFKELLKEGEKTSDRAVVSRAKLFETLKRELQIHERMEEEVLYPALKKHSKAKDIVLENHFSLKSGHEKKISIDGIGELLNVVA